jgi:hypothetical protein
MVKGDNHDFDDDFSAQDARPAGSGSERRKSKKIETTYSAKHVRITAARNEDKKNYEKKRSE